MKRFLAAWVLTIIYIGGIGVVGYVMLYLFRNFGPVLGGIILFLAATALIASIWSDKP